jgi:hypothetical protein
MGHAMERPDADGKQSPNADYETLRVNKEIAVSKPGRAWRHWSLVVVSRSPVEEGKGRKEGGTSAKRLFKASV